MKPKRKLKAISGIRDFCVCSDQSVFLAIAYDVITIYDTFAQSPILSLKLDASPRFVKLSPNGMFFVVVEGNNSILIYNTKSGTLLQKIVGIPHSIKCVKFSKNSSKIIYATTQILSIWNIRSYSLEIRTQNWKNINCYDISYDGCQFVLGTYNGTIFMISYLNNGKCSQVQIKRHRSCIVSICFHQNKIISASYDGHLVITTLDVAENGDRLVSYNQMKISYVPRQIQSHGSNFYLFDHRGVTWFADDYVLVGLVDSRVYKIFINDQGQLIFVKLVSTEIEWWPGKAVGGAFGNASKKSLI